MTLSRWNALATAAVLISGLAVTPAVASPPENGITLITGDRVHVVESPGEPPNVVIRPAPGRERMPFLKTVLDGTVSVIPFDAQPLVANGVLDKGLFDVSKQQKAIIRYQDSRPDLAGTDLPSINSIAVEVTDQLWRRINPKAPNQAESLPNITKISADKVVHPLDKASVEQIKAPRAWQRGHTAKGVKVAVLDTGVDAEHPDLKGRIAASKDFTEQDDVSDPVGHGTHVAGIIAGAGPEPGTAPDANLLIGRVCERSGCEMSAIIAGMQWAVEQGAKVVNLSLGGEATDGTDELSQAVNALSDKALFVVAAGNEGADESVSTPASADAALAVASVTRDGQTSYYSSRGPRTDGAVKPEISAPGYAIAAARAQGTAMGYPINERHTLASGTSMATPHVAGAAAILAGQHPDWSPARLKAALTNTADPSGKVFEQGTGVVNVDRATRTLLTAEPAALKSGGTITYRNDGTKPATLKLTAPDEVRLDRATIEVPARGTATVKATAAKESSEGSVIVARDKDNVLRTAVSTRVIKTNTGRIKVQSVDRQGALNGTGGYGFLIAMANHDNGRLYVGGLGNGHALEGDVPQGRYTVFAWVPSPIAGRPPWEPSQTLAAKEITVGPNGAEAVLDAQAGRRVAATVNGTQGTGLIGTSFGMPNGSAFASQGDEVYVVPSATPGMIYTAVQFVRNVPGSTTCGPDTGSPCAIALSRENAIVATNPAIKDADLARVDATIGGPAGPGGGEWVVFTEHPLSTPPPGDGAEGVKFPGAHRTYYHSTGDLEWFASMFQTEPERQVVQGQTWRRYANGKAYEEKWGIGVLGPSVAIGPPHRRGNLISAELPLLSDPAPGHYGFAGDFGAEGRTELRREGKLVDGTVTPDGGVFQVPPGKARYRLEAQAEHQGPLSRKVAAAWEFTSKEGTGPLPLTAIRFEARDGSGVPFRVEKTSTAGRTRNLVVDVSYDDGKSWQKGSFVLFGDRGVLLDAKPGALSLRTRVTDVYGNSGEQSIIRALT